ncbi:MAG: sulfatase-like hydrolase/transferase, partial [Halovenus sp.]
SLRADHCGFMGYGKETTPTLDGMARDGLSFEAAVAPGPSTYESMPAIVTGEHMCSYPVGDGSDDVYDSRGDLIGLNTRRETIAEWFARQGYDTAAFTTNPYTGSHTHFSRGFDHYEDFMGDGEGPWMRKAAEVPVLSELKHLVTLVRGDRASKPWQDYYEDIVAWVEDAAEPYFLWVFLLDPHTPYLSPGTYRDGSSVEMYYRNWKLWARKKWGIDLPLDRHSLRDLYDATVRSSDAFLDSLQADLPGDPVIAVHSDHGEAFGEHGAFGHHGQVYEENLHVPFVVWNAGRTATVDRPVSLTSLATVLRGAARETVKLPSPDHVLARTLGPRRIAVRDDDWKYIATTDPEAGRVTEEELYDLESDPGERENRAGKEAERVEGYRQLVERRLSHERELSNIYRVVPGVG